jgi:glucose-1-phosphate adenylyltransferase
MVLAGGKGTRLYPLTAYRSKPSVPFGGIYRIIDFVLSNLVNSGIKSIYVLTQFKSQSLTEHLQTAWAGTNLRPGNFCLPVPAQMQTPGEIWYSGTADAIAQNINLIRDTQPDLVCIFGGDNIYIMDVRAMLKTHVKTEADVTIAAIPVPKAEASRFGVMEVDLEGRVIGFHEKVPNPPTIPGDPARCYASMGNYVFSRAILEKMLLEDQAEAGSSHDFGKDILPKMVAAGFRVQAYDFQTNWVPGWEPDVANTYWRDVGTLEAYYESSLGLKDVVPHLDIYNERHFTGNRDLGLVGQPVRARPPRTGAQLRDRRGVGRLRRLRAGARLPRETGDSRQVRRDQGRRAGRLRRRRRPCQGLPRDRERDHRRAEAARRASLRVGESVARLRRALDVRSSTWSEVGRRQTTSNPELPTQLAATRLRRAFDV